jgi:hypothetical protein
MSSSRVMEGVDLTSLLRKSKSSSVSMALSSRSSRPLLLSSSQYL